jgi:hypothetical protein
MRVTRRLLFACLALVVCAVPASANSVCVSENFASMGGTSCSVGGMTFSFNGTTSLGGGWTSSSLFFTPTANGFTLNFLGGPQSIAANNGCCGQQDVFDELGLEFNVTAPQGFFFSGVSVSSAAHIGATGPFALAFGGVITQSTAGGAGHYITCTPTCQTVSADYAANQPFSSTATVDAEVFDLIASQGTAFWDGAPATFTFALDNSRVPEPGSFTLLGVGLLGLLAFATKRLSA